MLRAAAAVLTVAVAGLGPVQVHAVADPVALLGPGAVTLDVSHDTMLPLFVNATDRVVTGQRSGAGCIFPSRLRAVPGGGGPQGEMTLAVSDQTCRALVRAGSLAGLPPGPSGAGLGGPQGPRSSAPTSSGADPCSVADDRIWQTDPVGLYVTWTENTLNWCYSSSGVTSCSETNEARWLAASGWYVIGGPSGSCLQPDSSSAVGREYFFAGNDTFFCGQTAHTRSDYDFNEAWGNSSGTFWDNSHYSTWGACSNLLSWHHTLDGGPR
jgi:hypothetical protein